MAISKRKTKTGVTAEYHYEFMQNKKRYFGVCEGCTTERSAREYEKRVKEQVKELAEQKSARKLVENFRDQLAVRSCSKTDIEKHSRNHASISRLRSVTN